MNTDLRNARYISFATFRRDGRKVATPIWAAPYNNGLVMFSAGNAGKVKRVRNSAQAEIAICDVRGKLLGDWINAEAFLLTDSEQIRSAHTAMLAKYSWQMRLLDAGAWLSSKIDQRAYIRIIALPS
jgi:PPOX class probable F420-dependent enzyme